MIRTGGDIQVWVATAPVDMRKSFDGLAEVVRAFLGHNPLSGNLFVFRNRSGHRVKVLWWDKNGLALYYKRMEKRGRSRCRPRSLRATRRSPSPPPTWPSSWPAARSNPPDNPACSARVRPCAFAAGVVHPRPP